MNQWPGAADAADAATWDDSAPAGRCRAPDGWAKKESQERKKREEKCTEEVAIVDGRQQTETTARLRPVVHDRQQDGSRKGQERQGRKANEAILPFCPDATDRSLPSEKDWRPVAPAPAAVSLQSDRSFPDSTFSPID